MRRIRKRAGVDTAPSDDRLPTSRRRFLSRGAITAAVAAAGGAALAKPAGAGAGDNQPFTIGASNTNGVNQTSLSGSTTAADSAMFRVFQGGSGSPAVHGVVAASASQNGGAALYASASNTGGIGIKAEAYQYNGVAVLATTTGGSGVPLRLVDGGWPIPPVQGDFLVGDFLVSGGHPWYCYVAGNAGDSKWVKLSSTLVTLAAPFRVYDSRFGQTNPSGSTQGTLNFGGGARVINCAPALAGAPAATLLFNVTLANMVGAAGSVLVWAFGAPEPLASTINWSAGQATIANGATSACDADQRIQIKCTSGTSTNVILDVIGYYL